jgi:hypothetical protein
MVLAGGLDDHHRLAATPEMAEVREAQVIEGVGEAHGAISSCIDLTRLRAMGGTCAQLSFRHGDEVSLVP